MGLKDELGGRGHEMGPGVWVQRVRLGAAPLLGCSALCLARGHQIWEELEICQSDPFSTQRQNLRARVVTVLQ